MARRVLIVGKGVVGTALFQHLRKTDPHEWKSIIGAREVIGAKNLDVAISDYGVVVHAGGPAGEAACLADPAGAFAAHYTLTERLLAAAESHLVSPIIMCLGTLAPNVGFYAPLKRAAVRSGPGAPPIRRHVLPRNRRADLVAALSYLELVCALPVVVECGQIIGPGVPLGRGVAGEFLLAALRGRRITVHGSGNQQVFLTPIEALASVVMTCDHFENIAPVTSALRVRDLAEMCIAVASELKPGAAAPAWIEHVIDDVPPSYENPSPDAHVPSPVPDAKVLLRAWGAWAVAGGLV